MIADCNRITASRNLRLNYKKHGTDAQSASYFVNDPERIIITFMAEEGERFRSFFFIGSGDGTLQSGVDSLASCVCLFRALEPNLTQEEAASLRLHRQASSKDLKRCEENPSPPPSRSLGDRLDPSIAPDTFRPPPSFKPALIPSPK